MNDRTCIVTRKNGQTEELLRFVADPDGWIVPDIKGNLPGRGAWVSLSRSVLLQAIKSKAFSRSLKRDVDVDENLVDLVDALLVKMTLGSLSMARKAGGVITGSQKLDSAIRAGQVRMVLHALEAAEDGKRKIAQAIHAAKQQTKQNIEVISLFTKDDMHVAFGGNHVVHAAILNVQASEGFVKSVRKLQIYREILQNTPNMMTVEP